MGSLVLGNKATAPGAEVDPETAKYRRQWKINVDKVTRYEQEICEAERIWGEVSELDYKEMKARAIEKARKKEGISYDEKTVESKKQLEAAQNALRRKGHNDDHTDKNFNDLNGEEQDRAILQR